MSCYIFLSFCVVNNGFSGSMCSRHRRRPLDNNFEPINNEDDSNYGCNYTEDARRNGKSAP